MPLLHEILYATKGSSHRVLSVCGIPTLETLTAGHIASSDHIPGSEFNGTTNVTMNCAPGRGFPDHSTTKVFSCIAYHQVSPLWQDCSSKIVKLFCFILLAAVVDPLGYGEGCTAPS